jgi:hypothetical protein
VDAQPHFFRAAHHPPQPAFVPLTQAKAVLDVGGDGGCAVGGSGAVEDRDCIGRGRGACAVTGKLAKYFDPLTRKPYADLAAFRKLRADYAATNGNRSARAL